MKKHGPTNSRRLSGVICLFLLFYPLQKFISVLELKVSKIMGNHKVAARFREIWHGKPTLFSLEQ